MAFSSKPRVGLVLGAGGVIGASYLAGALEGVRRATGWEPADAEVIVGTSAGAFIAGVMASGISPALMYARVTGEHPSSGAPLSRALLDLADRMDSQHDGHWAGRYLPLTKFCLPRPVLASPRLALDSWRKSKLARWEALATGLLGEGILSSQRSIGAVVKVGTPAGWTKQKLWIVACDLDSGRRVVFGREDAPVTDLHLAVSAATAIPAVFAPVVIDGRRYCDAGLCSPSNVDVVRGLGLDAVLCVNPLSGGSEPLHDERRSRFWRSLKRAGRLARSRMDRFLAEETRVLEAEGTKVFVLHPNAEDIAHFPLNSMDLGSRPAIMKRAARTAAEWALRDERLVSILTAAARAEPTLSDRGTTGPRV